MISSLANLSIGPMEIERPPIAAPMPPAPHLANSSRERRAHEAVVEAKPAILLADAEAPGAERADFLVQLPRHFAGLVPFRRVRRHFRRHEAADGFAERPAFLGFEGVLHVLPSARVWRAVKLTHKI